MAALLVLTGCASGAPSDDSSVATTPTATASTTVVVTPSIATEAELAATLDELATYDASMPLDDQHAAPPPTALPSGVRSYDINWASPGGGRVSAWLVRPPESMPGPYAGLVYVHGSETDRDDLLDEAEAMATVGVISLVLDAPFARPTPWAQPYLESYNDPAPEAAMTAQAIVDVRRAYDLLVARPDIDPARLGFVGHSWGASLGVDVAAVDPRPVAFALLSPRPSWTGFLRTDQSRYVLAHHKIVGDAAWERYLEVMAPFDGLAQIGRVEGERILLQYGRLDDVVPPNVAQQLIDAAPDGMTTQWFENTGHALDEAAVKARCDWLAAKLGLSALSTDALATVGLPDQ